MTEPQIGLLKSNAEKYARNRDIDPSTIDIESLIDSSLSHEENWHRILKPRLKKMAGEIDTPDKDEIKDKEQKINEKYIKHVERKKKEELKSLHETNEPDRISEIYRTFNHYVSSVAQGHHTALMVESPPGLGKSYQITRTLSEMLDEGEWVKHSGYSAPLAFYKKLYENKDKVIFLDDIEGLLNNKRALANLKQATWSEGGDRIVEWNSSSSKLDETPKKFVFEGRLIMCFNDVPSDDPIFESLKSRCLFYDMNFTYSERLEIIGEIAKHKDYKDTTQEERLQVYQWLVDVTEPEVEHLNLRTYFKCLEMYRYSRNEWTNMAEELFEIDDLIAGVRRAIQQNDERSDQINQFKKETGRTRRTFYRKKEELEKKRGDIPL